MLMRHRIVWTILAAIPLAWVLHMWIVTGGLPYNTDSNESFSAFVQGQNLVRFDPWANAFLPDDANANHPAAHPFTYTHGPNLPRYFSAAMLLLGVHSLAWQILIAAVISTLLSVWFISRSFPDPINSGPNPLGISLGMLIVALFATDFIGVLQFLGNLWRTWHFPLFWGCIWAVRTKPRWPVGFVLFFLLFQLEFLFAFFTAATLLCYLLWVHRGVWLALLRINYFGMLAGAAASVILFIGQLVAFYGWHGFLFDLETTYVARNTNKIEWESIRQFYESHAIMMWPSSPDWDFRFPVYLKITLGSLSLRLSPMFAVAVLVSLLVSIIFALLAARARRAGHTTQYAVSINESVGPLLWAMLAAYLLLGVTIPGYALNGYTYRWAPLLVFPVTLALALLVANTSALVSTSRWRSFALFRLGTESVLAASLIALWLGVSIYQYGQHPNFVHTPAAALATTYKGHSFVSATTFPHMIAHYTGRWAYYTPQVFPGNMPLDQSYNWNADRNKNPDYETPEYYLCEKLPYYKNIDCDDIARQMMAFGHELVERHADYVIMKLNWNLPPRQPSNKALAARDGTQ